MSLHNTVCESGSNEHAGDCVKSSGRLDLFSILQFMKFEPHFLTLLIFEGTLQISLKKAIWESSFSGGLVTSVEEGESVWKLLETDNI